MSPSPLDRVPCTRGLEPAQRLAACAVHSSFVGSFTRPLPLGPCPGPPASPQCALCALLSLCALNVPLACTALAFPLTTGCTQHCIHPPSTTTKNLESTVHTAPPPANVPRSIVSSPHRSISLILYPTSPTYSPPLLPPLLSAIPTTPTSSLLHPLSRLLHAQLFPHHPFTSDKTPNIPVDTLVLDKSPLERTILYTAYRV